MMELFVWKLAVKLLMLVLALLVIFCLNFIRNRFTDYNTDFQLANRKNVAVAIYEGAVLFAMIYGILGVING